MSGAKRICAITCGIIALLALILISVAASNHLTPEEDLPGAVIAPASTPLYIVKAYQGTLGLFSPGTEAPVEVYTHIRVQDLPDYDQNLLREGISVYTLGELQSLLEDFES